MNAGTYAIVASLNNDDYQATNETGTLVITKKALVGSFTASDKVYDGNTSATIATRSLTA